MNASGASSPCAAYAELNLDSEGTGNSSGAENPSKSQGGSCLTSKELVSSSKITARSASPATKRSAAIMEDDTLPDAPGESKLRESESVHQSIEPPHDSILSDLTAQKSSVVSIRNHARDQSVDMLGEASTAASFDVNEKNESAHHGPALLKTAPENNETSEKSSSNSQNTPIRQPTTETTTAELPPIDEQIHTVSTMMNKPMEEGDQGYVISQKWLGRVLAKGSDKKYEQQFGKEALEEPVGPIDNGDLNLVTDTSMAALKDEAGEPFVPLRPGLSEQEDFQILPKEAWDLVMKWYGNAQGSPVLVRYCHNTSDNPNNPNLQYELYPPTFVVLKLPDRTGGMTQTSLREKDAPPAQILASRSMSFQIFLRRLKACAKIPSITKVRLWRILGGLGSTLEGGMITPAQSRANSPSPNTILPVNPGKRLVLDVNEFTQLQEGSQRERINVGDNTNNPNYNGSAKLGTLGLGSDSVLLLEEQIGGPAGGEFVSDATEQQSQLHTTPSNTKTSGNTTSQKVLGARVTNSGRTSPAAGHNMLTRGRPGRAGRGKGTVGLSNLGNTCYMNSALQCVRSVEELTEYFLCGKYKSELNPQNPLSHNGNVARAYANLLHEMYVSSNTSFAPRQFKGTIGKYGASFSGYGQQDSQEFLLFLLDGLQEDLNRIHEKPYVEYRDSTDEMVHDQAALKELADDRWQKYKLRNDSVITDLFAGMYKSTVTCPGCDKVSIIFDPFNNLTLQIPIESCWTSSVVFFPLRSRPILVPVDINKSATFWQLKEYMGKKMGVAPKNLVLSEIYKGRFYKMYNDKDTISEAKIVDRDIVAMFEVDEQPSNYPAPKRKKKPAFSISYHEDDEDDIASADPSLSDRLLIPVFHREAVPSKWDPRNIFGYPFYIVVDREEAKDYDAILRKVLGKIDTLTTRDFLRENEDSSAEDSDTGIMTHEEATSSASSGVAAHSIESEDGMVDITMRVGHESSDELQSTPRISYPPSSSTSKPTTLPRMLRSGECISSDVRGLFNMKYFKSHNEVVPTGFQQIADDTKDYPSLLSRRPQVHPEPANRKPNLKQRIRGGGTPESSDEDEEEENDVPELEPDNPDDSDDGLPPVEQLIQPRTYPRLGTFNQNPQRLKKRCLTYSRKGKGSARQAGAKDGRPDHGNPALIRLSEAIICEWTSQGYDALFGRASEDDNMRGEGTWEDVPMLDDPTVVERKAKRDRRRREGVSLDDCLDEFGRAEVLSESEAWFCPRCKEHRQASKMFQMWKAPDILVIHLKRFSAQGRFRDKLDVMVNFPIEGLDLSGRVLAPDEDKSLVYDLFAVDNHYGGLGGGHYTAFAKNFKDGEWYDYNGMTLVQCMIH